MLVTTGLNLQGHSLEAVERELPAFWDAVDLFAKRKVDRIALSGVPVASMLGRKRMRELLAEAQSRSGLPCDTDLEAHVATLKHFGARRMRSRLAGASRPTPPSRNTSPNRKSKWSASLTRDVVRHRAERGPGRRSSACARARAQGALGISTGAGVAHAGWAVARDARRADAGSRIRQAGAAQHPFRPRARRSSRPVSASSSAPIPRWGKVLQAV